MLSHLTKFKRVDFYNCTKSRFQCSRVDSGRAYETCHDTVHFSCVYWSFAVMFCMKINVRRCIHWQHKACKLWITQTQSVLTDNMNTNMQLKQLKTSIKNNAIVVSTTPKHFLHSPSSGLTSLKVWWNHFCQLQLTAAPSEPEKKRPREKWGINTETSPGAVSHRRARANRDTAAQTASTHTL